MNTKIRKIAAFAVAAVSTLGMAGTAFAGQYGWFTHERPASACRTFSPNVWPDFGALVNSDSGPQGAYCPLDVTVSSGQATSSVWAKVNAGANHWATVQTCTIALNDTNGQGSWFPARTVTRGNGIDTISFDTPVYAGTGAELECSIAPNQVLFDYSERQLQFFDFTSW
jgi:hypothetical protein